MNLEGVWRLWTENSESVAYVCGKSTSHSVLLAVYIWAVEKAFGWGHDDRVWPSRWSASH